MKELDLLVGRIVESGDDLIFFIPWAVTLVVLIMVGSKLIEAALGVLNAILGPIFFIGDLTWLTGKIIALRLAIMMLTLAQVLARDRGASDRRGSKRRSRGFRSWISGRRKTTTSPGQASVRL